MRLVRLWPQNSWLTDWCLQIMKSGTVSSSTTYSMLLLSTVIIVGLSKTSDAIHSVNAPGQSAFHAHPIPQTWTPSGRTLFKNRIEVFPLLQQLGEGNWSILHGSNQSPVYKYLPYLYIPLENSEGYCLGSCQAATRQGKLGEAFILDFFVCFRKNYK